VSNKVLLLLSKFTSTSNKVLLLPGKLTNAFNKVLLLPSKFTSVSNKVLLLPSKFANASNKVLLLHSKFTSVSVGFFEGHSWIKWGATGITENKKAVLADGFPKLKRTPTIYYFPTTLYNVFPLSKISW